MNDVNEVPTYRPPDGVHGPTLGRDLPDGCERCVAHVNPRDGDHWLAWHDGARVAGSGDVESRIEDMLVRALGLTMHLASESRDANGNVCCCICGGDYGLINTVPGWGGVFVCRTCNDAEKGDQP